MNKALRFDDTVRQFYSDVGRLLGPSWYAQSNGDDDHSRIATSAWTPAVDIAEETDRFVIYADLPGVEPKEIDVTMLDGELTIRGERVRDKENADTNGFQRKERAYGSFYRRFSLPDTADAEHISARGENGVLVVTLPKKQQAQPRRITVQ